MTVRNAMAGVYALVVACCAGCAQGVEDAESPPDGPRPSCTGNPDAPAGQCDDRPLWTCEVLPNGDKKCAHSLAAPLAAPQPPPGPPSTRATPPAPTPGDDTTCLYAAPGQLPPGIPAEEPMATIIAVKGVYNGTAALRTRVTFNKRFVDNTYGANSSPGYGKGPHTFAQLVGSDHVVLEFRNTAGQVLLSFALDYITAAKKNTPGSGYACQGVLGGEGQMNVGPASAVLAATSSLDVNLNTHGYVLLTDSPKTDLSSYSPNPSYPKWIFDVWYEAWVSLDAIPALGAISIPSVHASPSRLGTNTILVVPGKCP